jgi:hypothetical protein
VGEAGALYLGLGFALGGDEVLYADATTVGLGRRGFVGSWRRGWLGKWGFRF